MSGAPFDQIEHFAAALPRTGPLLGLDLGTKTIGVATSDIGRSIATPLETIKRRRFSQDYERLAALISERNVVGIVAGLPLNMDGSEGPRSQSVRAFMREFGKRSALPAAWWDERLSTAWAERRLIENELSRAARAEVIDRVAAGYILQGALDRLRALNAA